MNRVLILVPLLACGCLKPSMSDGASGNWLGRWCTRLASPGRFEDSLVFQPRTFPDGDWTPPARAEDAWFESADGRTLHGWFASPEQPRAVVLFLHGNTGNVTYFKNHIRLFTEKLNCAVLCCDYGGYGRSEGRPSESTVADDARAARQWLANRCNLAERDVILAGHSLGGGIAVELASTDGTRGLILWNTFTSIPDVARSFVPLLPMRSLMHNRFDSVSKISRYHGPLLITHGDSDVVIPYKHGLRLFAAANEPKQFIPVRGGDHNDPPSPEFMTALDVFLGGK